MRQERAGDHDDAFARHQLFGHAHGFAGIGAVVARDHFQFLAEHAALGVDLLHRQFHALLVRVEEGGLCLITVELADFDSLLCRRRRDESEAACEREIREQTRVHDVAPCRMTVWADSRTARPSLSIALRVLPLCDLRLSAGRGSGPSAVSYTHLTLPTKRI